MKKLADRIQEALRETTFLGGDREHPLTSSQSGDPIKVAERELRRLRSMLFDNPTPEQEAQIEREIDEVKYNLLKATERRDQFRSQQKGPYSGLTRGELRASGTSEPDWY